MAAAARAALASAPLTAPAPMTKEEADAAARAALSDPRRLLRRLQAAPSSRDAERTLLLGLPHLNHIHLSAASVRASRLARNLIAEEAAAAQQATAGAEEEEQGQEQDDDEDAQRRRPPPPQQQQQHQQQQEEERRQTGQRRADLERLMGALERLHERALPRLPARALAHLLAAEAACGRALPPKLARGCAERLLRSGGRLLDGASARDLAMLAWGLAAHERRAAAAAAAAVAAAAAPVGGGGAGAKLWQPAEEREGRGAGATGAGLEEEEREEEDEERAFAWRRWPDELWADLSARLSRGGGGGGGGGGNRLRALDLRQLSRLARAYASVGRDMGPEALEALADAALEHLQQQQQEQQQEQQRQRQQPLAAAARRGRGEEGEGADEQESDEEENDASDDKARPRPAFVPLARNLQAPDPEPLVHLAWALGRMGGGAARPRGPQADALMRRVRAALEPQLAALPAAALAAAVGGFSAARHGCAPGFVAAAAPHLAERAPVLSQDALVEVSRACARFPPADEGAAARLRAALAARCAELLRLPRSPRGGVTPTSARKLLRDLGGSLPEEVRDQLERRRGGEW